MKKTYGEPWISIVQLPKDDILTMSGDNDAPFVGGNSNDAAENEGWGRYY